MIDTRHAERRLRRWLWLYPPRYRRRYGDDMVAWFLERQAEWGSQHRAQRQLWRQTRSNILRSAVAEWRRSSLDADALTRGRHVSPEVSMDSHPQNWLARALRPRLLADSRYAFRRWRRRPGFAIAAIATLALGIGSATAVFSVVDQVLLKPLPWTSPDTLVQVHGVYPERRNSLATAPTWDRWYVSYPAWDALRESPAFSDVAAWRGLIRLRPT